jgi:hypothetical protein
MAWRTAAALGVLSQLVEHLALTDVERVSTPTSGDAVSPVAVAGFGRHQPKSPVIAEDPSVRADAGGGTRPPTRGL